MAVTPLDYDDIEDIRWNPFANGGTGDWEPIGIGQPSVGYGSRAAEIRQVPNSAPYVIKLYEIPQQNAPSTMDITLEVGGTQLNERGRSTNPGNLEYRVIYPDALAMGEVEFNSNQAGQNVVIAYYGLGHGFQKISLDTRVPSTGNTTIEDIKTFTTRIISDQGVSDDTVYEARSSDVNHGGLEGYNTTTYGALRKSNADTGGLRVVGLGDGVNQESLRLESHTLSWNTSGAYAIRVNVTEGGGAIADDDYIIGFYNNDVVTCLIGGTGLYDSLGGGVATMRSNANVSDPPTDAELDAAFSGKTTPGFLGVVDDAGSGLRVWFCVWTGSEWWYEALTKAV